MSNPKKIGFFWGEKIFRILEVEHNIPVRVFSLNHQSSSEAVLGDNFSDDIHKVALIQKTLRDERLDAGPVKLSIPATDTLIRSFVIPAMKTREIPVAVEFEVKKYIPFSLNELAYGYYSKPFVDGKVKRLRITFVAIRRELLDRYVSVLDQAGLMVAFCEPSPMSLTRTLIAKKEIQPTEQAMVISIVGGHAEIIFVDHGLPQLMRDVYLTAGHEVQAQDLEMMKGRFFNEVRMSMDFFTRQTVQLKPIRLVIISVPEYNFLAEALIEDLGIPGKVLDPESVVSAQSPEDFGFLNAFGAALSDEATIKSSFNLIQKKNNKTSSAAGSFPSIDFTQFQDALKIGAVCLVILGGLWGLSAWKLSAYTKRIDALTLEQGTFASMAVDQVNEQIQKLNKISEAYKNIRLHSDLAPVLVQVPGVLKSGMWFKSLNFHYDQSGGTDGKGHFSMILEGYAFVDDSAKELHLVNDLVTDIHNAPFFDKNFNSVQVSSVRRDSLNDRMVTFFTMECSS